MFLAESAKIAEKTKKNDATCLRFSLRPLRSLREKMPLSRRHSAPRTCFSQRAPRSQRKPRKTTPPVFGFLCVLCVLREKKCLLSRRHSAQKHVSRRERQESQGKQCGRCSVFFASSAFFARKNGPPPAAIQPDNCSSHRPQRESNLKVLFAWREMSFLARQESKGISRQEKILRLIRALRGSGRRRGCLRCQSRNFVGEVSLARADLHVG